jgi:hypothetical protein
MNFNNWKSFWSTYRRIEVIHSSDLYYQVGKTVNGIPISVDQLQMRLNDISVNLDLNKSDILFELCCGNGLLTLPLSKIVKKIYAFDFTEDLIQVALKHSNNVNIIYFINDAKNDFFDGISFDEVPTKFLMNESLSYFQPSDLSNIILNILRLNVKFKFFISGVPDESLMWNFYNTDERKKEYYNLIEKGDEFLNGIGKWWKMDDIQNIANNYSLKYDVMQCSFDPKYRVNLIFSNE